MGLVDSVPGCGLTAVLALWLRRHLPESAYEPDPPAPTDTPPLLKAFCTRPRILMFVMLLPRVMASSSLWYPWRDYRVAQACGDVRFAHRFRWLSVTAYGFFALALKGTIVAVAVVQPGFGATLGGMGVAPAMLAEAFPGEFRLMAYSLAFNFGLGLRGGTTPLIARVLIDASGVTLVPAFYLMFGAFLAMSLYFMPDRRREPLL